VVAVAMLAGTHVVATTKHCGLANHSCQVNVVERPFYELRQISRLSSPVLVHELSGLTFLLVPAPGSAATETEHGQGMHPEADAPANERPVEPPPAANQDVDYEQGDVDQDVGGRMDVEAFEGLYARMRSVVALLLLVHVSLSLASLVH
jgi:hypothetical protein